MEVVATRITTSALAVALLLAVLTIANGQNDRSKNNMIVAMKVYRNSTNHLVTKIDVKDANNPMSDILNSWKVSVEQHRGNGGNAFEALFFISAPDVDTAGPGSPDPQTGGDQEVYIPLADLGQFKIPNRAATAREAEEFCEQENAELLTINTVAQLRAMKTLLASNPRIDGSENNEHIFISDQNIARRATVDASDDTNGGVAMCVTLRRPKPSIAQIPCSTKAGYICHKP